eukprot:10573924-Ditylum_brightwellii.AAC.1
MQEQKEDGNNLFIIGELPVQEDPPTTLVYNESESQEPVPLLVMKLKCVMLNCMHANKGKLKLLGESYVFTKLAFPNLVVNWHCSNLANNILPYRVLSTYDFKHMNNRQIKLNMM